MKKKKFRYFKKKKKYFYENFGDTRKKVLKKCWGNFGVNLNNSEYYEATLSEILE